MNSIRVIAGDLHRSVGGYPGHNHRMVCCCNAMRSMMTEMGDRILAEPPSGNGANLIIEYQLPRTK
jgi:5-methylcytosine-specific restriction protein A